MSDHGLPNEQSDSEGDHDLDELEQNWALGPQLAQLFESPEEFDREITTQVDRRLRARSTFGSALELVGLGWATMRVLLIEDPPPADRESEGL
ncbi:MAG TPA: hypothetical protein VL068_13745 [Microthrixaceae bacterium]|nr:hypothetical protein [Microthrixaceae bacterium]